MDSILGIRDDIGAVIHTVHILKRTRQVVDPDLDGFSGGSDPVDEIETNILPTPRVVDYSHSLRLKEAGNIKQGDLVLKQISKNLFTREIVECLNRAGESKNIERYYLINNALYTVISVSERYLWFDVQIRRHSDTRLYLP